MIDVTGVFGVILLIWDDGVRRRSNAARKITLTRYHNRMLGRTRCVRIRRPCLRLHISAQGENFAYFTRPSNRNRLYGFVPDAGASKARRHELSEWQQHIHPLIPRQVT